MVQNLFFFLDLFKINSLPLRQCNLYFKISETSVLFHRSFSNEVIVPS